MTAVELLAHLRALDVHVRVEGGRLRVNAPKGRMTPDLEALLVAGKDELLRALEEPPPLAAVPRGAAPLPLSFFQERLWVLDRLQPGLTTYNIVWMAGPMRVDVARLAWAIGRVAERHEILRARIVSEDGVPGVRVGSSAEVPVTVVDLRGEPAAERERVLGGARAEAARVPFDLAADGPVRFTVFRTTDDEAALLISAHHIALDTWSCALLGRELLAVYASPDDAADDGPVTPPALQYADFAQWQRRVMAHPSAAARLAYWTQRLAGLPALSVFPADRPRAGEGMGAALDFEWSAELTASVRALARTCDATVYMVLLAAVTAVLHRHTGQTDLAIGSPMGTRDRAELETMLGPIVNPLVLRFDLADDPTFAELVARAREAVLEGHGHQEVPFERIVQELNPARSVGQAPLFQVAVVLHNTPDADAVPLTSGGAIYDLTIFAAERGGRIVGSYEYRTDLYDPSTIGRIAGHVERLLAAAAGAPATRVSALPLIDEAERAQVVSRFNATAAAVDEATVVAQFARTAAARPDDVAVVTANTTLTYGELDRRSARVAAHLRTLGAGRGRCVALATDRSSALPVAALGILRTGAAYVPVDLSYPPERVALMLRDSGVAQIVTSRGLVSSLRDMESSAATVVVLEDVLDGVSEPVPTGPVDVDPADAGPTPDDVAYVMYTSGSTGTPKGVRVPHAAVSNFLGAMRERLGAGPAQAVVAVTSESFDISVLELFLPLVEGGRTIVASRDVAADGARLAELVRTSGATLLQATPSGWRLLMRAGWEGSPTVTAIAGGETVPPDLVAWLRPRTQALWNGYGPTEATVYATMARLESGDPITIGTPLANTRVYVLDAHREPVAIGVPGEIYIAGAGVARGYHARAALTAERFVADHVTPGAAPGERMYRTGDVGRWRADGRLEHLVRLDGQVKVRGYRIETGEIEAALATHELVKTAVVGVQTLSGDEPRIVAWVQLHDDEDCTTSELRRHLRQRLPEFMIPSMIVRVDGIALTPSGKVDRRALPDPFATSRPATAAGAPPSTPAERMIAEVWTRLLHVEQVSVTDGFFELGGHSLLAMRAASEISSRVGQPLDPRLLFFRTLGQLAEACDALARPRGTSDATPPDLEA